MSLFGEIYAQSAQGTDDGAYAATDNSNQQATSLFGSIYSANQRQQQQRGTSLFGNIYLNSGTQNVADVGETTSPNRQPPAWYEGIANSFLRGINAARVGYNWVQGDTEELAQLMRDRDELRSTETYERFLSQPSFSDAVSTLVSDNPLETAANIGKVALETVAESAGSFLATAPLMIAGKLGGGAVSALAGGSAGTAAAPGPGTVAGGGTAGVIGQAIGGGLGSFIVETGNKIMESFAANGVDVRDPAALERAFSDEQLYTQIRNDAMKRGVAVGLFDGLSMAIGGSIWGRSAFAPGKSLANAILGTGRTAGQRLVREGAEMGLQAGLGMAGEAAGQLVSGEDLNTTAIFQEGLGEAVVGVGEGALARAASMRGGSTERTNARAVGNLARDMKAAGVDDAGAAGAARLISAHAYALGEAPADYIERRGITATQDNGMLVLAADGQPLGSSAPDRIGAVQQVANVIYGDMPEQQRASIDAYSAESGKDFGTILLDYINENDSPHPLLDGTFNAFKAQEPQQEQGSAVTEAEQPDKIQAALDEIRAIGDRALRQLATGVAEEEPVAPQPVGMPQNVKQSLDAMLTPPVSEQRVTRAARRLTGYDERAELFNTGLEQLGPGEQAVFDPAVEKARLQSEAGGVAKTREREIAALEERQSKIYERSEAARQKAERTPGFNQRDAAKYFRVTDNGILEVVDTEGTGPTGEREFGTIDEAVSFADELVAANELDLATHETKNGVSAYRAILDRINPGSSIRNRLLAFYNEARSLLASRASDDRIISFMERLDSKIDRSDPDVDAAVGVIETLIYNVTSGKKTRARKLLSLNAEPRRERTAVLSRKNEQRINDLIETHRQLEYEADMMWQDIDEATAAAEAEQESLAQGIAAVEQNVQPQDKDLLKIDKMRPKLWRRIKETIRKFPQNWVRSTTMAKRADDLAAAMLGVQHISEIDPSLGVERRQKAFLRLSESQANQWLFEEPVDATGGRMQARNADGSVRVDAEGKPVYVESLRDILSTVRDRADDFQKLVVARRVLSRYAPNDLVAPITPEQARQWLAQYGGDAQLSEAVDKFFDWTNAQREYLRQLAPGLSPLIDQWVQYDYAPLFRLHPSDLKSEYVGAPGRGGQASPTDRVTGGMLPVKDIIEQIGGATVRMIRAAHAYNIQQSLIDMRDRVPGFENLIARKELDEAQTRNLIREMEENVQELSSQEGNTIDAERRVSALLPMSNMEKATQPTIRMYEDGKVVEYTVPPDLYRALNDIDVWRFGSTRWGKVLDWVFGKPTRAFRLTTTGLNPGFSLVTNPIRDVQTFLTQTESASGELEKLSAFAQAYDVAIAQAGADLFSKKISDTNAKITKRASALNNLIRRAGMNMSKSIGMDMDQLASAGRKLLASPKQFYAMTFVENLRDALSALEIAPRLAEGLLWMEENNIGVDADGNVQPLTIDQMVDLINRMSDVTVDFREAGEIGKVVNQIVPFFNANIQGMRLFGKNMEKDPELAMVRGLQYLTLPTLWLWDQHKDEDWYKDKPEREKYLYWWITDKVKIPRAFDWGNLFSVIPEATIDAMYRKDPKLLNEGIGHSLSTMIPIELPVLGRIAAEQLANEQFFFERPIVPEGEERIPAPEQYGEFTSEASKLLGRFLYSALPDGTPLKEYVSSPRRLDHIATSLFSGVGRSALEVLNPILGGKAPSGEVFDVITGRIIQRGGKSGGRSRAVAQMYDDMDALARRTGSTEYPLTAEQQDYYMKLQVAAAVVSVINREAVQLGDTQEGRDMRWRAREIAMNAVRDRPTMEDVGSVAEADVTMTGVRRGISDERARQMYDLTERVRQEMPGASEQEIQDAARQDPRYRSLSAYSRRAGQLSRAGDIAGLQQLGQQVGTEQPNVLEIRNRMKQMWQDSPVRAREYVQQATGETSFGRAISRLWGDMDSFRADMRRSQQMSRLNLPVEAQRQLDVLAEQAAQAIEQNDRRTYNDILSQVRSMAGGTGAQKNQLIQLFINMARTRQRTMRDVTVGAF